VCPDPVKGPDRDVLVEATGAFQASVMRKTIAFIARYVPASIDLALFPSRHFSRTAYSLEAKEPTTGGACSLISSRTVI
jgi:hypothetical protein